MSGTGNKNLYSGSGSASTEYLAGKKPENLSFFELVLGKIFFLCISIQKVKVTPLNQFRELQIFWLFSWDLSQFSQNLWPEKTFLRTKASWGELFRTCFQHNLLHIVPISQCPYLMLKPKYAFTAGSSNWGTTLCNIWGISPYDLLDIVLRYCLELDETMHCNVMEENYNFGRDDTTLIPPPLHLYTAPPPPWEERHHHHCPKNVEQADTFWALIRSPAPSEAGLRIGEGFRAGFLPDGSRPGLRLQLLGWCCLRASCGCIVRAQPHPHPPIHTRDQHYPGPRPGQQSWLFWSCQHKHAKRKMLFHQQEDFWD